MTPIRREASVVYWTTTTPSKAVHDGDTAPGGDLSSSRECTKRDIDAGGWTGAVRREIIAGRGAPLSAESGLFSRSAVTTNDPDGPTGLLVVLVSCMDNAVHRFDRNAPTPSEGTPDFVIGDLIDPLPGRQFTSSG